MNWNVYKVVCVVLIEIVITMARRTLTLGRYIMLSPATDPEH